MASDAAAREDHDAATGRDKDWFVSISGQLRFASTGERARLRKLGLGRVSAADGSIIKLLTAAGVPASIFEPDYDRWRLILHCAAMLAGTGALASHDENRRLGTALFEAGVSETRLMRLLAARDDTLADQVRLLVRLLARQRQPVNLWTLYHLIGADDRQAAAARLRIAQDYYAADARSKKGTSNDD